MDLIEKSTFGMGCEKFGADIPITAQETFVIGVYRVVDEAAAREMDRLYRDEGIVPSCTLGCCYCCRHHIVTNIAEAHTLAQYIKRELSAEQIDALRKRTQQWHAWDDSRPGRYPSAKSDERTDLSNYDPCCPMLVDGACIAYPVRPVVCRTHYVCSDPVFCRVVNDPESTEAAPVVLTSVVKVARPFSKAMRDHIENAGLDFSRSIMLLPHWLAIEMNWDFAITR